MDLSLIPTDALTAELAKRYPHGCFAGVVDWDTQGEVEQHRGEVWGNAMVVLGLIEVLRMETFQEWALGKVDRGGDYA